MVEQHLPNLILAFFQDVILTRSTTCASIWNVKQTRTSEEDRRYWADYKRDRDKKIIEMGLCRRCRKPNTDRIGKWYCSTCYEKSKATTLAWKKRNHDKVIKESADYYTKRRIWFNSLKTKCSVCEETHPACLEFHHVNPSEKDFTLGKIVSSPKAVILAEIKKCIILCANCHRKLHWPQTAS